MTWRWILPVFAWLAALPARAAPVQLVYSVTQLGLEVMEIRTEFEFTPLGYRMQAVSEARGLGRLFLPRRQVTAVEGGWQGNDALPAAYHSEAMMENGPRRVVMRYRGREPLLLAVEPNDEAERLPVPPEQRLGTVDVLSALAKLVRVVGATGRCEAQSSVFDGRRRMEWSSRTLGQQNVRQAALGWNGPGLVCGLESRMLAGYLRRSDPAQVSQPRRGEAVMVPLRPGLPPLPVHVELPGAFGGLRVDLVRFGVSGQQAAQ